MEPTAGLIDHVTAVFEVPVTIAVNCWLWPEARVTLGGLTVTVAVGLSITVAVADWAGSAALVALTGFFFADGHPDRIIDVQWSTDHLRTLGIEEMPREEYLRRLERALELPQVRIGANQEV